ncbi:MAG: PIN domain-containing protein [Deltaproteobacteria bacterium]|nr:PIN domain-containing protein [Deltaproteobacteria bacterium]MBN2671854.1 PIN domain-containing protein [Deltaproteobacteria bacterium]
MARPGAAKMSTMSKVFFDTNILIYAADKFDVRKQQISRKIIREAAVDGGGVVSTQVLQEFIVIATKKLGLSPLEAKEAAKSFLNFETVVVSPDLVFDAVDAMILNKVSFWDSLIVCAAAKAACEIVYTEDLNHGQQILHTTIVNPFVP